jgi:hypothetical protein
MTEQIDHPLFVSLRSNSLLVFVHYELSVRFWLSTPHYHAPDCWGPYTRREHFAPIEDEV